MAQRRTRVLSITSINPPHIDSRTNPLDWFNRNRDSLPQDQVNNLLKAAHELQTSSVPVAFPTETVYGLGADATRSEAVRGIYAAKNRPSDNPLIVHVGSVDQLRALLRPPPPPYQNGSLDDQSTDSTTSNGSEPSNDPNADPIPSTYKALIRAFWPGPLTLLFPVPSHSPFAREVTSSLNTVGIRMPSSPLARLLISLCDRPLAAPSANASTRPSPTTAAHVLHDLDGRIDLILDGGPCGVGVESTVLDGLVSPPTILRPGGVGIEEIRRLGGRWRDVRVGYQDPKQQHQSSTPNGDVSDDVQVLNGEEQGPRAPGMKYRHYAPTAQVHLFEEDFSHADGNGTSSESAARAKVFEYCITSSPSPSPSPSTSTSPSRKSTDEPLKLGLICTSTWPPGLGFPNITSSFSSKLSDIQHDSALRITTHHIPSVSISHIIYSIQLGPTDEDVARGLFSALRELDDAIGCKGIVVEGLRVRDGEPKGMEAEGNGEVEVDGIRGKEKGYGMAAAVMNRLRKAASGA